VEYGTDVEEAWQIMITKVMVLSETTHIVELVSLMSAKGIRQIAIVNAENRLVGMVYQVPRCMMNHLLALLKSEASWHHVKFVLKREALICV
jgi:CBS-domain-containing membrane protein